MRLPRFTLALPILLVAAACEQSTGPRPIHDLPRPLTDAEADVARASNAFAFDLLREVIASEGDANVFLSPFSASMALGMTMNGARGSTFEAMSGTLGFGGLSIAEINASYRGLLDLLDGLDPRVELQVGNSIWYREGFPVEQAFFDTTRAYFDAEVAALDFTSPASVDRINGWVADATNDRIDTILESIGPDDVMYLINAIYFKGDWTAGFDRADTRSASFFDSSGETRTGEVEMMSRKGPTSIYTGDGFTAADLPYGGGAFSMTVVLPDPGVDVNDLLSEMSAGTWAEITGGLTESSMGIQLPKFRLEYGTSLDDALQALGMEEAFDERADFSGMSPVGVMITDVLQKTFVNVDEEGTEAAAVTAVGMGVTSAPSAVVVDRPFLFAIREKFSGTILFIGKMMLPASA